MRYLTGGGRSSREAASRATASRRSAPRGRVERANRAARIAMRATRAWFEPPNREHAGEGVSKETVGGAYEEG